MKRWSISRLTPAQNLLTTTREKDYMYSEDSSSWVDLTQKLLTFDLGAISHDLLLACTPICSIGSGIGLRSECHASV